LGGLPFLFKLLAAGKPLSIQAHPNLAQAREGFERENKACLPMDAPHRSYRDSNHKPEIICALTPFTGMCGFREIDETKRLLAAFLAPAPAFLREGCAPLAEALSANDNGGLRKLLDALFSLPPAIREALTKYILSDNCPQGSGFDAELMHNFARLYPGDPAVIAPLYLNVFRLAPGEAIFLKAGVLHAYCHGFGVELMANSDNVLRGGLTPKHIDVGELMKVLDFSSLKPQVLKPEPGFSRFTYPTPCEEFSLTVMRGSGETAAFAPDSPGRCCSCAICIVTEGEVSIGSSADAAACVTLKQGESAFIPPPAAGESLTLRGHYTLYAAGCNIPCETAPSK